MFGDILKVYDDHVIVSNNSNVIDTNYLNLYVIFNHNENELDTFIYYFKNLSKSVAIVKIKHLKKLKKRHQMIINIKNIT